TAKIAATLTGEDGRVTVFTVVVVPRGLLNEMRGAAADSAADRERELTAEYRSTQADNPPVSHWAGDDAVVSRYVNRKVTDRTTELATELEALGVEYKVIGEEGEDAAQSVLVATRTLSADAVCIGTHGLGRFEGLLGSLSTKVARLAPCSVVLIR
ncbi:MAG: universal stress protein, partial [Acidimicrobiales bacterium]